MKRLTNLMLEKMAEHNKQMSMLIAISQVPWENLKVDEVVCVSDSLAEFIGGKHSVAHFIKLTSDDLISTYRGGKSSATNTESYSNDYKFALPVEVYKKITGIN